MTHRSPRRLLLFRAILLAASVFFSGVLLLGYYIYTIAGIPRYPIRVTGSPLMQRDPEIGFVPVPHGDTAIHHFDSGADYHVTNDRLGARVNRPGEETPDRVELMTLGCSFTWGYGVRSEDTYAQRLKQRFGISTANLAMAGYGSIQSLQTLRRQRALRPRTVIYGVIGEHLRRNVSPCAASFPPFCVPTPYFELAASGGRIHPPPAGLAGFDSILRDLVTQEHRQTRDVLVAATWALRSDFVRFTMGGRTPAALAEAMEGSVRFAIGEMAKTAREMDAELIVVYIPDLIAGSIAPPPSAVLRAVSDADVKLVDVTPAVTAYMEGHPGALLGLTAQDSHPNPEAHRLIEEQIAAVMQRSR